MIQTFISSGLAYAFMKRLFHTLLFYAAWILCLKSAALEASFTGLLAVGFVVIFHLYRSDNRKADLLTLLSVVAIGPLSDTFYSAVGLLHYTRHSELASWFPPLWIFFLWALFGVNIHLFSWMKKKWGWMLLFGGVGAPISYLSAVRLGGATLLQPLPVVFLVIGVFWILLLPGFIYLNDAFRQRFAPV